MSGAKVTKKIIQCEMCGALTIPTPHGVCGDCLDEDQKLYEKARDSIKFGESVTPEIIQQRTGIELKHIRRWIKYGRLSAQG
jgi:NMD protein affecting ribosome stability and mRNA decay